MERRTLLGRLSWQLGEVVATQPETARTRSITVTVPNWMGHRPGQHVDVRGGLASRPTPADVYLWPHPVRRNRRREFRGTRTRTSPSQERTIRTDRRSMMEKKLDINTAGGILQVTFPFDMTLVEATCAGCGATNGIGGTTAYMHG